MYVLTAAAVLWSPEEGGESVLDKVGCVRGLTGVYVLTDVVC